MMINESDTKNIPRVKVETTPRAKAEAGFVVPGSRRKSMKGIRVTPNSPLKDVAPKLDGTRALSRDLYMNAPLAVSILERHRALDIGSGLVYQAKIDAKFLGLSNEQADEYQRTFEREFDLWANSYNSDFDGSNFFGDNQALGLLNMFLSGDFFLMPVWRDPEETGFPYKLTVKLIDADLVRDPVNVGTRDIVGGVEYRSGRLAGYHLWDTYKNEHQGNKIGSSIFVPVFDSSGRQQIFHVVDIKRIKQRRGVALLAPMADLLKQMTRLTDSEVMNSLVASLFTVFIRDMSGMPSYLPEAIPPEDAVGGGGSYGPDDTTVREKNPEDSNDLEMGYGNITYLDENKDVTIAEPTKTDRDFAAFWKSQAIQVTAAAGLPLEQAMMHYETSYTAARAAFLDVWQHRKVIRKLIARRMCQPVLQEFFIEATTSGRISAPGFFDDYAIRSAWLRSSWIGPGMGALDPLREAKADAININGFLATREELYTQRTGDRWDAAMESRAVEQRLLEKNNLLDKPDPSELVGPDGQEDPEDSEDEADKDNGQNEI